MEWCYWAAQLGEWVVQDEETNWIGLDNSACPLIHLETIPFIEQNEVERS